MRTLNKRKRILFASFAVVLFVTSSIGFYRWVSTFEDQNYTYIRCHGVLVHEIGFEPNVNVSVKTKDIDVSLNSGRMEVLSGSFCIQLTFSKPIPIAQWRCIAPDWCFIVYPTTRSIAKNLWEGDVMQIAVSQDVSVTLGFYEPTNW